VPVAAYAQREGGEIRLRGFLADADGGNVRRGEERARWPESENEALEFGQALGAKLKR
jgi:porphobilinogen deaminase